MVKYILRDGKEVKFGDTLKNTVDFGFSEYTTMILFNETSLPWLKELGIIREVHLKNRPSRRQKKPKPTPFKLDVSDSPEFKEKLEKTRENLDKLVDEKLKKNAEGIEQSIIDWHLCTSLESIAKDLKVSKVDAIKYIDDLIGLDPSSAFSLLSKRIAAQLDKKYNEPIENLRYVHYVSRIDGKVYPIYTRTANLNNFAAFRNEKDAEFAIKCLHSLYKIMFNDSKQEDN